MGKGEEMGATMGDPAGRQEEDRAGAPRSERHGTSRARRGELARNRGEGELGELCAGERETGCAALELRAMWRVPAEEGGREEGLARSEEKTEAGRRDFYPRAKAARREDIFFLIFFSFFKKFADILRIKIFSDKQRVDILYGKRLHTLFSESRNGESEVYDFD
jgi:hypothetical protein